MHKVGLSFAALLFVALTAGAQAQAVPTTVNVRYDQQISNGPAGQCGCFGLEGGAFDANLPMVQFKKRSAAGLAADLGMVHTNSVNGAPYGLTLTTLTVGPRYNFPVRKVYAFTQALFGFAHGSNSAFPQGNTLVPRANSFAFDLGAGADYPIDSHLAVRVLQLDYLHTTLPNNTTNWQNNLRIGVGFTVSLSSFKRK